MMGGRVWDFCWLTCLLALRYLGAVCVGGCDLLRWPLGRSSPVEDVTTRELDFGGGLAVAVHYTDGEM